MSNYGPPRLVACPACGNAVSPAASQCPRCGHPAHAPAPMSQQPAPQYGPSPPMYGSPGPPQLGYGPPPPYGQPVPAYGSSPLQHGQLPQQPRYGLPQQPSQREIRPVGLLIGLALLALGVWLLAAYIPAHDSSNLVHDPAGLLVHVASGDDVFLPETVTKLQLGAGLLIVLGLVQLATGTYKKKA